LIEVKYIESYWEAGPSDARRTLSPHRDLFKERLPKWFCKQKTTPPCWVKVWPSDLYTPWGQELEGLKSAIIELARCWRDSGCVEKLRRTYRGQTGEVYLEVIASRDGCRRLHTSYGGFVAENWDAVQRNVQNPRDQLVAQAGKLAGRGSLVAVVFDIDPWSTSDEDAITYILQQYPQLSGLVLTPGPVHADNRNKLITKWSVYRQECPTTGYPLPNDMFDEPHVEE
jgi:hypothetical protein